MRYSELRENENSFLYQDKFFQNSNNKECTSDCESSMSNIQETKHNTSIQTNSSRNNGQHVFAFFFVFAVILNGYATGIPGVSMGSMIFIIITLMAIPLFIIHKQRLYGSIILLPILCIFLTCISLFAVRFPQFSNTAFAFDICKLILWAVMSCIVAPLWFDYQAIYKQMYRFAVVMTIYITLQTLAYRVGLRLPNLLSFGPIRPYHEGYAGVAANSMFIRPAGLHAEPAFYASFMNLVIPIYFEYNIYNMSWSKWATLVFFSAGVVMSTSTTGIVLLLPVWMAGILRLSLRVRSKVWIIGILAIFVFLFFWQSSGNNLVNFTTYKVENIGSSTRGGASFEFLQHLNGIEKLLGVGWGNAQQFAIARAPLKRDYMNSATALMVETGYIGSLFFSVFLLRLLMRCAQKKDLLSFVLLAQYITRFFVARILFDMIGILYVVVAYYRLYVDSSEVSKKNLRTNF